MCRIFPNLFIFAAAVGVGISAVYIAEAVVSEVPLISLDSVELRIETEETDRQSELLKESIFNDLSQFESQLLETGEGFHGNEITARSGEIWLGLFAEGKSHYLAKTKIKIETEYDSMVDDPGEMTGKSVSVEGENQPLFLLKNTDYLKEGAVKTVDVADPYQADEAYYMDKGFDRTYMMNGISYRLRVLGADNHRTLLLESDGIEQIIYSGHTSGYESWYLVWVGDLDGDGKLDFYANIPTYDNFFQNRLFLSSKAKPGDLVKQVALFHQTGC
jgi:hypothetical protein